MGEAEGLKDARDQLNLVLSFFPRVDAKLSTILAIDTAMLAYVSAGVTTFKSLTAFTAGVLAVAVALLAISYLFLYRGAFPSLRGGNSSVVYFRSIANRTETKFIEEYQSQTIKSLKIEVLSQVWRNSEILSYKFTCLKIAFITMACATPLWALSLALFAAQRANLTIGVNH